MVPEMRRTVVGLLGVLGAVAMVAMHIGVSRGGTAELTECGRNGCYEDDSRIKEAVHPSNLDPFTGSQQVHQAYSQSGEIRGGKREGNVHWRPAKKDRGMHHLEQAGVNVGGEHLEKAIPTVYWDKSEYDRDGHRSPKTAGDLRKVRQDSRMAQKKLESLGVNVDGSWLPGRTHKFPTDGYDKLNAEPCSEMGTYVALSGGMQSEPYVLGGVSVAEHKSRDMLELSGVKVGSINTGVRGQHRTHRPCLMNSPIVGADEKPAGVPDPLF